MDSIPLIMSLSMGALMGASSHVCYEEELGKDRYTWWYKNNNMLLYPSQLYAISLFISPQKNFLDLTVHNVMYSIQFL
jgi:hypothetical protein